MSQHASPSGGGEQAGSVPQADADIHPDQSENPPALQDGQLSTTSRAASDIPGEADAANGDASVESAGEAPGQPAAKPTAKPAGKSNAGQRKAARAVVVRYGLMGSLGRFRHNLEVPPKRGDKLVVRTDRGVELGEVVADIADQTAYGRITNDDLAKFLKANGPDYPFKRDGRVLRRANKQDVIDHRHLRSSSCEEASFCRSQIKELSLDMKLVSVEHLLGGERIIFNFSAESRVDFRELVRRLAKEYRTRIEMRQVGARDEARLLADYERCGQRCCCQQFMKDLKPVSMRMAKVQKATLDPSKISGRCGRLMCCLRFEDTTYEALKAALPKKNTWVRTDRLVGRVTDTQILTQLVQIELPDHTSVAISTDQIVERDMPQPSEEQLREFAAQARRQAVAAAGRDSIEIDTPAPTPAPAQADGPGRSAAPRPQAAKQTGKAAEQGGESRSRKRRRRRRPGTKAQGQDQAPAGKASTPAGKANTPAGQSAAQPKPGGKASGAVKPGKAGKAKSNQSNRSGQTAKPGQAGQAGKPKRRRRRKARNKPAG